MKEENEIPFADECESDNEAVNLQYPESDGSISIGVLIDTTNVKELTYSKKEFDRGLKEYSYAAGAFTALVNAGMPSTDAINYIMNMYVLDTNKELTKMKCDAQVEASKFMRENMEREIL